MALSKPTAESAAEAKLRCGVCGQDCNGYCLPLCSRIKGGWNWYLNSLATRPILTKSVTSACLSAFSDLLSQRLSGTPRNQLIYKSAWKQFFIGLCVRGPVFHHWLMTLEAFCQKHVMPPIERHWRRADSDSDAAKSEFPVKLSGAVARMLIDQLFFTPLFLVVYFHIIGTLNGLSLGQIHRKISKEYFSVLALNYRIWPIAGLINFLYVRPDLRVLFGNIVAIFWMALLLSRTR